jgi:hypothetical protein
MTSAAEILSVQQVNLERAHTALTSELKTFALVRAADALV